jgi:hypothetical protein
MEPESFDFASCYFRNSDMGNLVGRVSHAMAVSLRHDGLVYYFRDGDYKFREIVLTRNYAEALRFLGYDVQRYFEGFEDLEEIFQYVASTPFFNSSIYLLENRNAQARVRDRKRPTYNAFLKWCECHSNLSAFEFPADKKAWHARLVEFFPQFEGEYQQAVDDLARQRALKERFNGDFVSKLTGLQGKELGGLMKRFKESFETPQAMHEFILTSDLTTLSARVIQMLHWANTIE